ncbi:uncharacterized protein LOC107607674 [Arachis ipaensis]|uniref:uncharacterized protein LOC107607674 n=1 Tax=Arachis ipaensis TaxID=130454 RepID=UPI0007AF3EAD|nr:uncharacterized protein LOC107607674 [Arachis ipaensis]
MGQDHQRLNSKVIAQYIFMMVKEDPTISIRVIQGGMENHFGYKTSYRKLWLAKQRVIGRIYRDWEESYNELSRRLFVMKMYLPRKIRTWVQLVTQSWPASPDTVMFHRVFLTFSQCIEIFKYFVEGEMKEAWSFFLSYLKQHVTLQPGLLVISDRHKSVDAALNANGNLWKPPHAFQAFCTRHIAANFKTYFKNKDLKKILINAAYSKSQQKFSHYFGRLRSENVAITN